MEETHTVTVDFQQILTAARQFQKPSQAKLVTALLQEQGAEHLPALEPLTGLSEAELYALAASVFAPAHARRLKQLLRLHRWGKVNARLARQLDAFLAESDHIAVVKAKANYTLSLLKA
jgi:hypothetical protein